MVAVLAMAEVQLVRVVVQAVREVCKVMSLAALVVLFTVLAHDQMVAHVVIQVVPRKLESPDTMNS